MVVIAWLFACGGGSTPEPPAEVPSPAPVAAEPAADEASAEGPELAASHILVAFAGAVGASPTIARTKEEAQVRAVDLHRQLTDGADFATLAKEASDDASGRRGGVVGAFVADAVDPAFAKAVGSVDIGSVTEPFETSFGWHVARRDPLEVVRARHILVSYQGARLSSETHSEAHARRMLDMLQTRLDRGADFANLAEEFSNDVTAGHGGDLGPISDGQLLPQLEQAIEKLRPGQRTVVKTPYGWHLVERTQ